MFYVVIYKKCIYFFNEINGKKNTASPPLPNKKNSVSNVSEAKIKEKPWHVKMTNPRDYWGNIFNDNLTEYLRLDKAL